MFRPTTILRNAAATVERAAAPVASSSKASTSRLTKAKRDAWMEEDPERSDQNAIKYILLNDVPRTALPVDILHALKTVQAVDPDFPLSRITLPPPSLPRDGRMTHTVHLSLPRHTSAKNVSRIIRSSLPFPFGDDTQRPCEMTNHSDVEWRESLMATFERENRRQRESYVDKIQRNPNLQKMRSDEIRFDRKWINMKDMEGKRVLVMGVPPLLTDRTIRKLVLNKYYDFDVSGQPKIGIDSMTYRSPLTEEPNFVSRLPGYRNSAGMIGLVCVGVPEALRVARKLNMSTFVDDRSKSHLLRASVIW